MSLPPEISGIERENKHRSVILLDVDNTLIGGFSIFSFSEFLRQKNLFHDQSFSQMQTDLENYTSGNITYERFALDAVDHYSLGLQGIPEKDIFVAGENFQNFYKTQLLPHTRELLQLMNLQGKTVAVSGAPKEAFLPMARYLGIQETHLLEAEVTHGVYTGKTKVNMALDWEKTKVVKKLALAGFNTSSSFAFGDSEHDIPLLSAVENPFAVSPNKALLVVAQNRNWSVVNADNIIPLVKKRLLELQTK